jgi:hypothetical protein
MGTVILLGIPSESVGTARSALSRNAAEFGIWSIKYVPAPKKEIEISKAMVKQTQDIAARQDDTHILGFSAQKNRRDIENSIAPYFRFRWFDHGLLKHLHSPDTTPFVNSLASSLTEESEWAARVKPADLSSPLLLPECSFEPEHKHRDLWRHACAYGDLQNVVGAEKAIRDFQNAHHRKVGFKTFSAYKWVDRRDRIFDKDGERHGIAPFPRDWKYSYRLEPGFHFDVTHLDGRQFTLTDVSGRHNTVNSGAHLNVDSHGFVI